MLPDDVRHRIIAALDDMGLRLAAYSHYRMTGGNRDRLRVAWRSNGTGHTH